MSVNKLTIRKDGFVDKQLTIPVQFTWDYMGQDQSIEAYETEIITEVIGVGRDFEVSRFANEPFSGRTNETAIKYQFYFYSGGTLTNVDNANSITLTETINNYAQISYSIGPLLQPGNVTSQTYKSYGDVPVIDMISIIAILTHTINIVLDY